MLTIQAASDATNSPCPLCGQPADRVHSRVTRTRADLPWVALTVHLRVTVHTFLCDTVTGPRWIFAERLPGVALAAARHTDRQQDALPAIAVATGGEAGTRLACRRGDPISPDPLLPTPTVLGGDDWASHKGLAYSTILVDLERHRPVNVFPDRSGESLAAWLRAPGGRGDRPRPGWRVR